MLLNIGSVLFQWDTVKRMVSLDDLEGTATLMITSFIWKILVNHVFWYQFHLNRLKNVEVVAV